MTKNLKIRLFMVLMASCGAVAIFLGCGGSQSGLSSTSTNLAPVGTSNMPGVNLTGTASASINVEWPERPANAIGPRLIPSAANSIKIELTAADSQNKTIPIATKIINRPATSVAFGNLPAGNLFVVATAYPGINAGGVPEAHVEKVLLVTLAGQTATITATMQSTITHIDIQPPSPTVAKFSSVSLTAVPRDATNKIVLVTPAKLRWTTSNAGIASVSNLNGTGIYKGVQNGQTTIRVTDTESGKFGQAQLSVAGTGPTPTPGTRPTVTPAPATPTPDTGPTRNPYGCVPGGLYNCGTGNTCPEGKCLNCDTGACEVPLVH